MRLIGSIHGGDECDGSACALKMFLFEPVSRALHVNLLLHSFHLKPETSQKEWPHLGPPEPVLQTTGLTVLLLDSASLSCFSAGSSAGRVLRRGWQQLCRGDAVSMDQPPPPHSSGQLIGNMAEQRATKPERCGFRERELSPVRRAALREELFHVLAQRSGLLGPRGVLAQLGSLP